MDRLFSITGVLLQLLFQWTYCEAFTTTTRSIPIAKVWSTNSHRSRVLFAEPETKTKEAAAAAEKQAAIIDEANDALASVGWARPLDDGEMTSEDPFVLAIDKQIQKDVGVTLEELLNPAKVVNLERDLFNLRTELATLTGKGSEIVDNVAGLSTEECDGGGGGDEVDAIRAKIEKKERDLFVERRSVFRGWLKNVFLGQAILSLGLSFVMATNPAIMFGGNDWYVNLQLEMPIKVLGFWWWWLFIVPSLRSRRPGLTEKKALDLAFLGTPAISLLAPIATKDTGVIWGANLAVCVACYAYAYLLDDGEEDTDDSKKPGWLKFVYKSLDFGSGRERGMRSWQRERMESDEE